MISISASFSGPGRMSFAAIPPGILPGGDGPGLRVEGSELCQLVTDWQETGAWPGLVLVEQKHDGVRAVYHSGDVVTRNEVPIAAAAHILPGLLGLERELGGPHVIDGEILHPAGFDATLAAVNMKAPPPDCVMVIFDAIPLNAFDGKTDCALLIERKAALWRAMQAAPSPFLRYVPHGEVHDRRLIRPLAEKAWGLGHEGIVIKAPRSPYVRGRSKHWQRLKRALTVVCPIIGIDASNGLGTLVVSHKGKPVRIVAGFSQDERRWLLDMGNNLIGRLVELEAMEITATGSLRQPRFSQWKERL